MSNEALIEILKNHKAALTTVKEWEEYADQHNLPSYYSLRKQLGDWNDIKASVLDLKLDRKSIIEIGKIHKHSAKNIRMWKDYALEHNLPTPGQITTVFKSWSAFKEAIEVENERSSKYTKGQIKLILQEHKNKFLSRMQWDKYAKEHNLPTYKTIRKYYTYEDILRIVEKQKVFNLTKEELIQLTLKKEHFYKFINSSKTEWDKYAREHNLPSSYKYINTFETWLNAKDSIDKIYLQIEGADD